MQEIIHIDANSQGRFSYPCMYPRKYPAMELLSRRLARGGRERVRRARVVCSNGTGGYSKEFDVCYRVSF